MKKYASKKDMEDYESKMLGSMTLAFALMNEENLFQRLLISINIQQSVEESPFVRSTRVTYQNKNIRVATTYQRDEHTVLTRWQEFKSEKLNIEPMGPLEIIEKLMGSSEQLAGVYLHYYPKAVQAWIHHNP